MTDEELPLLCARCLAELTPGEGSFFVVTIEAVADPTPPVFSDEDLARDTAQELRDLVEQLADYSERELMDQVHRRMVLHLCNGCFRIWIEHPAG